MGEFVFTSRSRLKENEMKYQIIAMVDGDNDSKTTKFDVSFCEDVISIAQKMFVEILLFPESIGLNVGDNRCIDVMVIACIGRAKYKVLHLYKYFDEEPNTINNNEEVSLLN